MGGRGGGSPVVQGISTETLIRAAYENLKSPAHSWVSLTQLRQALPGIPRAELDQTLREMNRTKGVTLSPQSNQKVLTQADRAAMLTVGNENKLLLSII